MKSNAVDKGNSVTQSVSLENSQQNGSNPDSSQFIDNRPESIALSEVKQLARNSLLGSSTAQLKLTTENNVGGQAIVQKVENKTGIPEGLKTGMENLSGMSLDAVKVHYNSSKPAAVQAHAFAQGTNIHLGQGQEKHLPHELGHVVQQAQGRVKPTISVNGLPVNNDVSLEKEADAMGQKAMSSDGNVSQFTEKQVLRGSNAIQRMVGINSKNITNEIKNLIKDPRIISSLTEAYTLLQHIDWAHNIVGGKVFDFTATSYQSLSNGENLIMVAHGSPGSSGGFSGAELGAKLADESSGLPTDWDGEIFVTSCFSGSGVDSVVKGIGEALGAADRHGVKVRGYGGTTYTHKQFQEFLFVLAPGMDEAMDKINDELAGKYKALFGKWYLKMQSLTAENMMEMADYTSKLTAEPYRELIEMAVKGGVKFQTADEAEVDVVS